MKEAKILFDNIIAVASSPYESAISIIRISGPDSIEILYKYFKPKFKRYKSPATVDNFKLIYGNIYDQGYLIDDLIVSIFKEPNSYTGENMVEVYCHGSSYIVNSIIQLFLNDTRLAEPGEFTKRAFLNNKMDLTQAEAVNDVISSKTQKSHSVAIAQYEGSLFTKISKYLDDLSHIRISLELDIDFTEDNLPENDYKNVTDNLRKLLQKLKVLLSTGKEGKILREGLKVSLAGPPNVGKSSIFNLLLDSERAIVTPEPGTTRDFIEEAISLQGYLIRFFDTAGIRKTSDYIEEIGIKKSYNLIQISDIVLYIFDNDTISDKEEIKKISEQSKIKYVLNKSDLLNDRSLKHYQNQGYLITNTVEENGLDEIKDYLIEQIKINQKEIDSGIISNTRQISALQKAIKSIEKAIQSFENSLAIEFCAFDLKEASSYLEEIIGKITDDDMLNKIFSDFCIGK